MAHYSLHMVLALCIYVSLFGGCANTASNLSISTTTPSRPPDHIPVLGPQPDGLGPFPAGVSMDDLRRLGPASSGAPDRWARELVQRGYVSLIPDSFTTRGHAGGVCTDPSPSRA